MKKVDMKQCVIVHCGEVWPHDALPCSRSMIKHLERNECIVTWVQVFLFLSSVCAQLLADGRASRWTGGSRTSSP